MKLNCMRAGFTLQRRAAGISSGAGLFLEEHLASCAKCRATANLLSGLGALHASSVRVLSTGERERVIAAALSGDSRTEARAPGLSTLRSTRWLAMPALAALAVLVVLAVRSPGRQVRMAPKSIADDRAALNVDRVLSGQVELAGVTRNAGTPLAEHAELYTATGALVALAHARTELRADTRAHWDASRHELQLMAGSVFVDVNEQRHERFMVKTEHFNVLVLGTRFEVALDVVSVTRGRVRVLSPEGAELAVLDAATKTRWQWTPVAPTMLSVPVAAHANSAKHAPAAPPAALLERARSLLVARQVPAARRTLEQVLASAVTPEQRAEALSLRAECALVAGEFRAAITVYKQVFQSFSNSPAGETALFAAARLEAEHGSRSQAAFELNHYLTRYPDGRFAKEARTRLSTVTVASPSP